MKQILMYNRDYCIIVLSKKNVNIFRIIIISQFVKRAICVLFLDVSHKDLFAKTFTIDHLFKSSYLETIKCLSISLLAISLISRYSM
jgi:hypothetical protein